MSKRRARSREASEQEGDRFSPFPGEGELLVIQQDQDGSLRLITPHELDFTARGQVFVGIESMLVKPKRNCT